jgi:uncharacterized protein (DUF427 family)
MQLSEGKQRLNGLFEPTAKRIRVEFAGETIVDSDLVMTLHEAPIKVVYYFPIEEVAPGVLQESDTQEQSDQWGKRIHWHVTANGKTAEDAAYSYETPEGQPDLSGYVAFSWNKMDAWYEQSEQVFGHARDPYHRIDARWGDRHVRVVLDGETIAEAERVCFVYETSLPVRHYLPPDAVRADLLTLTETHTRCPYKGLASYYSVKVGENVHEDLAWFYPEPEPDNNKLKDLIAIPFEKVEMYIDGERVGAAEPAS